MKISKKLIFAACVLAAIIAGGCTGQSGGESSTIVSDTAESKNISVTWNVDENGTLLISGNGEMDNYDYENKESIPWYDKISDIKSLVVEKGITGIGDYTFTCCTELTSITLQGNRMKK